MSLSNEKRSQLTEEVESPQNREEKHKQFKALLFLADEIQQQIEKLSRLRFTGIEASFPGTITAQLYQNLLCKISQTAKHLSAFKKLLKFLCLTQV